MGQDGWWFEEFNEQYRWKKITKSETVNDAREVQELGKVASMNHWDTNEW